MLILPNRDEERLHFWLKSTVKADGVVGINEVHLTHARGQFEIAITGTIIENPSFYSDIRRFGWSSYTSVVVINVWFCRLTGYVLRRRKK